MGKAKATPRKHFVYCFTSPKKAYFGYSVNPLRRERQHQRQITGGAKKTSVMTDGALRLVVGPFINERAALQFEFQCQARCKRRKSKAKLIEAAVAAEEKQKPAMAGAKRKASAITAFAPTKRKKKNEPPTVPDPACESITRLGLVLCQPRWTSDALKAKDHPPLNLWWMSAAGLRVPDDVTAKYKLAAPIATLPFQTAVAQEVVDEDELMDRMYPFGYRA